MAVRRIVQTNTHATTTAAPQVTDFAATRSITRNRQVIRSGELMETVQRLDTTTDPATALAIMQWINDEYEARQGGTLVGLFGKCYLGHPYVDHRMDLSGGHILEHYQRSEEPPGPYRAARPFARSDAYTFIEVYDDGAVIPIRTDGRPVL